MTSDFTAKVPELDARNASVSATTHGTFVTIAGQNINDLTATTDYANQQVTFDATAKQPQRTVAAAGSLVMHPDHNEVHLQRLSLATQGMTWQTAPGSAATIQYANNAVKVDNFKLVNGDQQITDGRVRTRGRLAEGHGQQCRCRHGRRAAAAAAAAVGPAERDAARSGRGQTRRDAAGEGRIHHRHGRLPEVRYDSFGGTVNYTGRRLTLDTKLQQNPTTWIDAKGRVPTALC